MEEIRVKPNPEAFEKADEVLKSVFNRSAMDPAFRRQLLAEPRTALAEHSGHEVPEEYNLVFIENEADLTIVLPDPIDSTAELSEQELEAVAGGLSPAFFIPAAKGILVLATLAAVWWLADEIEGDGVCKA